MSKKQTKKPPETVSEPGCLSIGPRTPESHLSGLIFDAQTLEGRLGEIGYLGMLDSTRCHLDDADRAVAQGESPMRYLIRAARDAGGIRDQARNLAEALPRLDAFFDELVGLAIEFADRR